MGRSGRSRKRKDAMNRVKRERNAKKELIRLKKTLGLLDADGNDIKMELDDIAEVRTAAQLKKDKEEKEEKDILDEIREEEDKGENVEVVNEKTQKVHVYNTKTLRDQYGTLPAWKKNKKTQRKINKRNHSQKLKFNQAWCTQYIPL
ncbi:hypothetical protein Bhyg_07501 [Pseudolycoriella hygida]|uniref:Uncharacterized protein n=1 Tax=Pseudolycoriella hygida TaxID=35572 RepID=A0A9Q0N4M3_9DIPT|nr:hypothetical protein Bhyg_07501 [Pseudolycoriella hygida]